MSIAIKLRPAMTAIEVLAATMLASLMMAAVVGMLSGLTRQQKLLMNQDTRLPWHDQLAAQLEWDLKNSQTMTMGTDRVKLEGFGARDFATSTPTGRPSLVEYFIDRRIQAGALLRRETHVDEATNDNSRVELVCLDVDKLIASSEAPQPGKQAAPTPPIQPTTPVPVPEHLSVTLLHTGRPSFHREITIR
jgi:hypothetical protein